MKFTQLLLLALCVTGLRADPGVLDGLGGHCGPQAPMYHCHETPCFQLMNEGQLEWYDCETQGDLPRYDPARWGLLREDPERHAPLLEAERTRARQPDGSWRCAFTGVRVTDPAGLELVPWIPLKQVWASGGMHWDDPRKRAFAESPTNLALVKTGAAMARGSKGLAYWKPSDPALATIYARRWQEIKRAHGLSLTGLERAHLTRLLPEL